MKKILSCNKLILVLFTLFICTQNVVAAEPTSITQASIAPIVTPTTSPVNTGDVVVVATVNIFNAKIISQAGNTFKVSFDISNRVGVQAGVKYAISLVNLKDGSNIDTKIYDETLALGENETIHKEVVYSVPAHVVSDIYKVILESKSIGGLPLANVSLGEVAAEAASEVSTEDSEKSLASDASMFKDILKSNDISQNLVFDKAVYKAGDVAHLKIFWTFRANSLIKSSSTFSTNFDSVFVEVSVSNKDGVSCILNPVSFKSDIGYVSDLPIPIEFDCEGPVVNVSLIEDMGDNLRVILSTQEYRGQVVPISRHTLDFLDGTTFLLLVLIVVLLIFAIFLSYSIKKNGKNTGGRVLNVLLFCIFSSVFMFSLADTAKADTACLIMRGVNFGYCANYSFSNRDYTYGETVVLDSPTSGAENFNSCNWSFLNKGYVWAAVDQSISSYYENFAGGERRSWNNLAIGTHNLNIGVAVYTCIWEWNVTILFAAEPFISIPFNVVPVAPITPKTLSVQIFGTGSGSVVSSPVGINCSSATCTNDFNPNAMVTLTASPSTNSNFTTGWGGACAGTNPTCTILLDISRSVTATFTREPAVTGTCTINGSDETTVDVGETVIFEATNLLNGTSPYSYVWDPGTDRATGAPTISVGYITTKGRWIPTYETGGRYRNASVTVTGKNGATGTIPCGTVIVYDPNAIPPEEGGTEPPDGDSGIPPGGGTNPPGGGSSSNVPLLWFEGGAEPTNKLDTKTKNVRFGENVVVEFDTDGLRCAGGIYPLPSGPVSDNRGMWMLDRGSGDGTFTFTSLGKNTYTANLMCSPLEGDGFVQSNNIIINVTKNSAQEI